MVTLNFIRDKLLKETFLPSFLKLVLVLVEKIPQLFIWFDLLFELIDERILTLKHIEILLLIINMS
jgi:hypothetical protein